MAGIFCYNKAQGSALGTVKLMIYINDLPKVYEFTLSAIEPTYQS